jgi:predicted MFS family arabinose efflux permease
MGGATSSIVQSSSNRIILFSLFLTGFATHAPLIISGLFLIDMGKTFGYPVGLTGQITTARSATAMVFALMMGVISIKCRNRTLLLTGLLIYSISAVGCFLAPNFPALLLSYSLTGIGTAMVIPMLSTIIGETLPTEERSNALGYVMTGQPISFIIGSPIVNYIAGHSGWRLAFIGYMLPVIMVCFVVTYISIPGTNSHQRVGSTSIFKGFREMFSNRSALACLGGAALVQASMMTAFIYCVSFFREKFLISTGWAAVLISGMALSSAMGNLIAGSVITRIGRRKTVTILALMLGVLNIITFNSGSLWLSSATVFPLFLFGWGAYTSGDSLSLEQFPEYRGMMMSINSAVRSMGTTFGAMMGGILLLFHDYRILGLVIGIFGLAAAMNYHLFTKDPYHARDSD